MFFDTKAVLCWPFDSNFLVVQFYWRQAVHSVAADINHVMPVYIYVEDDRLCV